MTSGRYFLNTRATLSRLKLPEGEAWDLPTSNSRFVDGAQFRIEVPTVNSLGAAEMILNTSVSLGIRVNRITETLGIFCHKTTEISEWVKLCENYGCELVMSPGPRAPYDTSATARSPEGSRISYRLRGQEQLIHAIEDVKRACDLGVRNFVIYDEGMLWILGQMRTLSELPVEVRFKASAHCGHGNAASLKLLQYIGADSVNPVRDLSLPVLSAIRSAIDIPIDIHTDNPVSSGGFLRFYDAPEFVRLLAPVYLKSGNSALNEHGLITTTQQAATMINRVACVLETIHLHFPEAIQSPIGQQNTSHASSKTLDNVRQKTV